MAKLPSSNSKLNQTNIVRSTHNNSSSPSTMARLPSSSSAGAGAAAPISQRRQAAAGSSLLPMHSSSGGDSSGEEATAQLLGDRSSSGGGNSSGGGIGIGCRRHPLSSRRRRAVGFNLFGRATAIARNNWKILLVAKLVTVLVLALVTSQRFHQHGRQQTGPALESSGFDAAATATPATGMGTYADDGAAGARPRYSVWSHGYRLLDSLRQRWQAREAPPHQGVSVAPDTSSDGSGMAQRCALPKPVKEGPVELHNQAFFLGGQAFDRVPPPPMASLRPRGVVISSTGTVERLAVGAYITAFLIRRVLNSSLPIEIYHVSDREKFDPTLKQQLETLGDVRVIDLVPALRERFADVLAAEAAEASGRLKGEQQQEEEEKVRHDLRQQQERPASPPLPQLQQPDSHLVYLKPSIEQLASYAAKSYSVLVSSFREAVLFDAGAVPFQDPEAFFQLEDYARTGFLVFRDYVPFTDQKWDWMAEEFCIDPAAIRDYYAGTEGDSSCVLVDKRRNWDVLLVATILNGPLQHTTYSKLNGDKDTWIMAMLYARRGRPLPPLNTVPGFLFVDYEGNFVARKMHGQLQMLKVDEPEEVRAKQAKHAKQREKEQSAGLLVPLYFNNQLFNFTQWLWNKGWT